MKAGGWAGVMAPLLLASLTDAFFVRTEGGVKEQFILPDEQTARLLFWVGEETGRAGEERYEEEYYDDSRNGAENRREEVNVRENVGATGVTILGQGTRINLTYIVTAFQYPTLTLDVSQRSQWLSAHFYHDRVYIPSAGVDRHPTPSSWWGRRVLVTSINVVYWHLCRSPYQCDPGSPIEQIQVISTSSGTNRKPECQPGVPEAVVVTLGVTVAVLALLSLALTAALCHLHRQSPNPNPCHQDTMWCTRLSQQQNVL